MIFAPGKPARSAGCCRPRRCASRRSTGRRRRRSRCSSTCAAVVPSRREFQRHSGARASPQPGSIPSVVMDLVRPSRPASRNDVERDPLPVPLPQQPQPEILRHVGVLILSTDVSEPRPELSQHLGCSRNSRMHSSSRSPKSAALSTFSRSGRRRRASPLPLAKLADSPGNLVGREAKWFFQPSTGQRARVLASASRRCARLQATVSVGSGRRRRGW